MEGVKVYSVTGFLVPSGSPKGQSGQLSHISVIQKNRYLCHQRWFVPFKTCLWVLCVGFKEIITKEMLTYEVKTWVTLQWDGFIVVFLEVICLEMVLTQQRCLHPDVWFSAAGGACPPAHQFAGHTLLPAYSI